MNAQPCIVIVSDPKTTVFRRGALLQPVTIVDVLDRTEEWEVIPQRQSNKRRSPSISAMFTMLFFFVMLNWMRGSR